MADLRVNFLGVEFKNPVLASSAEPTADLRNMQRVIESGAGGLVAKTFTDSESMRRLSTQTRSRFLDERHQVCHGTIPHLFTLYGRTGLQDKETGVWLKEVEQARKIGDKEGCVVIGSIASTEVEGWVKLAKMMEQTGVKMIELNFGCPHPAQMEETKTGMLVGQDKELASEIVRAVTENVPIPVVVKLTPQVADMVEIARAVKEAGASAVTVMNRFMGFCVDVEKAEPYIYGLAGVGGPWAKPLTLRWVYLIYKDLGIPISGSNGSYDAQDVAEFMMAGASVVQMCSVIMAEGYGWLTKTIRGLNEFLDRKGYKTAGEIIGLAAKRALTYAEMGELCKETAEVNAELCTLCKKCVETCFYNALRVDAGRLVVDGCRGCGICTCVCPEGAISLQGTQVNSNNGRQCHYLSRYQ